MVCGLVCHKNCYAPDFKDKNKNNFKCDVCKKKHSKSKDRKESRESLICCHCNSDSGFLKDVGGQEWMHVLCALTSPRVHISSYSSLTFAPEAPPSRINKARKCLRCKSDKG